MRICEYVAIQAITPWRPAEIGLIARVKSAVWNTFISMADWLLSWAQSYLSLKGRLQLPPPAAQPEAKPNHWKTALYVGLAAAAVLAIGYAMYNAQAPVNEAKAIYEQARALDPVCEKAVKSFCKASECLNDYLDPQWEPFVLIEQGRPLCAVQILANNCTKLVGQPTPDMVNGITSTPFIFQKNYEVIGPFKSHIHCLPK